MVRKNIMKNNNVTSLNIRRNDGKVCYQTRKIDKVPTNIRKYYCGGNDITIIENLPNLLHTFDCVDNGITLIENLPDQLRIFDCRYNQIYVIDNLPKTLHLFFCDGNLITKIERLPDTLHTFSCQRNLITKIERLPDTLHTFSCQGNRLTKIENLPRYLQVFYCWNNPITYVDNIPIGWFTERGGFILKWYNIIKKLQRRMKKRFLKKNQAARIIQKNCENWLWKPICSDGKFGINVCVSLKDLQITVFLK